MYAKILLMAAILLSGQVYAQNTSSTSTSPIVKAKKKKKKKALTTEAATTATTPVVEAKKEEVKPLEAAKPAEQKLSTSQEIVKYMKEHFSAMYHGEYYFVRRDIESSNEEDHKIKDFRVMHNPTLIYKPTKDWQALSTAEFKYSDQPGVTGPGYPNTFYRALFTVTRKNILTEKDHFIELDAGIGRRQFNTGVDALTSYGNNRVFTTLTKTYGKHNASLFLQYLYNDYKIPKATATTWKHALEVIPTINLQLSNKLSYLFNDDIVINTSKGQTYHDFSYSHEMNIGYINYQWTDKINTYYQLKYYHTDTFNQIREYGDWFEHYAGVGYAFTPKVTLTGEVGSEIFHSKDGRDFFSKKAKFPEFALYLDAAL